MDPNRACEDLTPNLGRPNDLAMKRGELERPRSSIHVMEKLQQSPDKIVQLTCFPPLIGFCIWSVRLSTFKSHWQLCFLVTCIASLPKLQHSCFVSLLLEMPFVSENSQPRISSYFQSTPRKRTSSHIDLTIDEDDNEETETSSKRVRLSENTSTASGTPRKTLQRAAATTEDWRFSPDKATQPVSSRPLTAAEKTRREAFKKKLLQDNSLFLRKEPDTAKGDAGIVESEEQSENEDKFEKLTEMFAHKSRDTLKGKGKSVARTQKVVERGPSGEPYTPLEKQVICITTLIRTLFAYYPPKDS